MKLSQDLMDTFEKVDQSLPSKYTSLSRTSITIGPQDKLVLRYLVLDLFSYTLRFMFSFLDTFITIT